MKLKFRTDKEYDKLKARFFSEVNLKNRFIYILFNPSQHSPPDLARRFALARQQRRQRPPSQRQPQQQQRPARNLQRSSGRIVRRPVRVHRIVRVVRDHCRRQRACAADPSRVELAGRGRRVEGAGELKAGFFFNALFIKFVWLRRAA